MIRIYIDSDLDLTLNLIKPSVAFRRSLQQFMMRYEISDQIQSHFYFGYRSMSESEIDSMHEHYQEYWDFPVEEEHFFWPLLFVAVGCVLIMFLSFILNKAKGYDKPELTIMFGASTSLLNWISDFQLMIVLSFKKVKQFIYRMSFVYL